MLIYPLPRFSTHEHFTVLAFSMYLVYASLFSHVRHCDPHGHQARPSCQAPLSMEFSRKEYWELVALPCSRGSSQLRDRTQVSHIAGRFFTI